MIIIYVIIEFLCGSLMFSYWLGLVSKKDLSTVGDGNPGAFICEAAGYKLGLAGVFLDFMKDIFPGSADKRESGKRFTCCCSWNCAYSGPRFSPFIKFREESCCRVIWGMECCYKFQVFTCMR